MPTEKTDIVKELRLRSWARQNYVASADRSKDWHPIVLDEMHRRDVELLAHQADLEQFKAAPGHVVPLMPSSLHTLHAPHPEVPAPKFLQQPQTETLSEELARSGWF